MNLLDSLYLATAVVQERGVRSRRSIFAGDGWLVVEVLCEELFPALQLLAYGGDEST